jgi:hypothetical protein
MLLHLPDLRSPVDSILRFNNVTRSKTSRSGNQKFKCAPEKYLPWEQLMAPLLHHNILSSGPGDSGRVLYNSLMNLIYDLGLIVLIHATTGIADVLLKGGRLLQQWLYVASTNP